MQKNLPKKHIYLYFIFWLFFSASAQAKSISVCIPMDNPPYAFYDTQGQRDGYNIDVLNNLDLPFEFVFKDLDFATSVAGLAQNICHMLLAPISPERAAKYPYIEMSHTLMDAGLHALVLEQSHIMSNADLQYSIVGLLKNSSAEKYALNKLSGSTIFALPNAQDLIALLREGEIESILGNKPFLEYLMSYNAKLRMINPSLAPAEYAFAISKEHEDVLHIINEKIELLREDGKLNKIYTQWFIANSAKPQEKTTEQNSPKAE